MATIDEIRKTEQALARRGTPMPYTAQAGDRAATVQPAPNTRARGAPGASGSWAPAAPAAPAAAPTGIANCAERMATLTQLLIDAEDTGTEYWLTVE